MTSLLVDVLAVCGIVLASFITVTVIILVAGAVIELARHR